MWDLAGDVASDLGPGQPVTLFPVAVPALAETVFVDGTNLGFKRPMGARVSRPAARATHRLPPSARGAAPTR